ncbi:MAG: hypothetical protein DRN30_00330 [Thermoplasmata archaeon]|nr:MAG: hypothetical protein DRN30_00330 [Thermoplasmata archaeon]
MNMRVLMVCPYIYPHVGGVESHVRDLSLYLSRKGLEVTILSNDIPPGYKRFNIENVSVIRTRPIAELFRTPIDPQIYFKAKELAANYDIIHAHFPPPLTPYFAIKAAKKAKKPFVLTYHCDPTLDNKFLILLEELYNSIMGKALVEGSDAIIVTSENYKRTSKILWRVYKYWVIPNAVDTQFFDGKDYSSYFREKYSLYDNFVMFVGRLVPHKNVEVFIQAAEFTDVKHVIIGDGPHRKTLERLAKRLRLEEKVLFLGKIPREDLRAAYSAADLVVLPSLSRLEAFGIVLLESLAMGTPVTAADIPGVKTVVDNLGLPKFDPIDPKDLASKIKFIIENKDEIRELTKKGQKLIRKHYSWENIISKVLEVYKSVLEDYSFV